MLKRLEGEESKSPYADMLIVSFPGRGRFILTLLLSLVSVCTSENLLLLNGHSYLMLI